MANQNNNQSSGFVNLFDNPSAGKPIPVKTTSPTPTGNPVNLFDTLPKANMPSQDAQNQPIGADGQAIKYNGIYGEDNPMADIAKTAVGVENAVTSNVQKSGSDLSQALYLMFGGQNKIDSITKGYLDDASKNTILAAKLTDPVQKAAAQQRAADSLKAASQVGNSIIGKTSTPEEIAGHFVGLGADVLAGGTLEGAAPAEGAYQTVSKTAPSILESAMKGAEIGGKIGLTQGAAQSAAASLGADKNAKDVATDTLKGGAIGGSTGIVTGGITGAITGAISKGMNAYQQRQAILGATEDSGIKPALPQTVQDNPSLAPIVKEAQNQGMSDKDINFLATASPEDKPTFQKMLNLAEQAQSNNRVLERPLDVVGDNGTKLLATVQEANSSAGEQLNKIANGLKGQMVDTTQMHEDAMKMLEDKFGITEAIDAKTGEPILDEKTGNPILDFSDSIFKKTPSIQRQLSTALSDLPDNQADASDLHQFKQSLYNLIDYNKQTGDTSGQAQYILKNVAHLADGTLDSNFPDYAAANADYGKTKDILDTAQGMIGKNTDFTTKSGSQSFGQALRSAFSNNKSRGNVLQFINDLQDTANQYGANSKQNLLDQALFTQILEENFGSPATTGLSGEVEKAIDNSKAAASFIKHPIAGSVDLLAKGAQKLQGQSPENKIAILKALLK